MGCNAWNHPSNCNCGWGGDTGGGFGGSGARYLANVVADVDFWRPGKNQSSRGFTNPNARCPVCSADVFFYQSPSGGRVFFDELGPPWPKHPCTDTSQYPQNRTKWASAPIWASSTAIRPSSGTRYSADSWKPLIILSIARVEEFDCISVSLPGRALPGRHLYVPKGWVSDAPAFGRWNLDDPSRIEIACFRIDENEGFLAHQFDLPNWLESDDEFREWRSSPTQRPSAKALNSIGFSLSFFWKNILKFDSWYTWPSVDLELARHYFECSAREGFWPAINNLGVIYRDGDLARFV